uniref:Glycosyltransferase n=1 Tax=Fundidesulfovibrio putealis TaxID=270496 RepID=A0A7C4AGN8_9BACT
MHHPVCLLLMLRAPVPGRVKTRLAAAVGEERAAALYRAFVEDELAALAGCGADVVLCLDADTPEEIEAVRHWLGRERPLIPQARGGLGQRMAEALRWAYGKGYAAAAVLGSDLPGLDAATARQLAQACGEREAVIGPAPDGGYWALGFRADCLREEVFTDMPWSTPELYALTMKRLEGLDIAVLPQVRDVDTLEDLRALASEGDAGATRRTLEQLAEMDD